MGKLLGNLLQTRGKMDENSVQNFGKKEQMKKKIDHEDFGCVLKSYFAKTNKKAKNTVGKKSRGGGIFVENGDNISTQNHMPIWGVTHIGDQFGI